MGRDAIAGRVAALRRGHRRAGPSLPTVGPASVGRGERPTVPGRDRPRAARRRRGDHGHRRVPRARASRDAAAGFSRRIAQVHAHEYRRPDALRARRRAGRRDGTDRLPAGRGAAGRGREVWLATGRCGRHPRRYRGHDIFWWARQLAEHGDAAGTPLPRVDQLPSPRARFACNAHVSGHDGGHDTNLRRMARDGIHLTGPVPSAPTASELTFAPDLARTSPSPTASSTRTSAGSSRPTSPSTGLEVGRGRPGVAVRVDRPETRDPRPGRGRRSGPCSGRPAIARTMRWLDLPDPRRVRGATPRPRRDRGARADRDRDAVAAQRRLGQPHRRAPRRGVPRLALVTRTAPAVAGAVESSIGWRSVSRRPCPCRLGGLPCGSSASALAALLGLGRALGLRGSRSALAAARSAARSALAASRASPWPGPARRGPHR